MAKNTTLAAGTSPFAHLLGGAAALAGRALGKRAEDDTPIDEEGPSNEDEVIDEVEDIEEPGDEGKKGKKARGKKAAADDDDDQDSEADADDDDLDEGDKDDEKAKAFREGLAMGRARENARCARIFQSKAAAGRPDLAATLAFTTRNTSAEAGRLMTVVGAAPAARGRSLDDRMGERRDPRPGAGGDRGGKPSFSARVAAAKKKAGIS